MGGEFHFRNFVAKQRFLGGTCPQNLKIFSARACGARDIVYVYFGWGRAEKQAFVSPCVWRNMLFLMNSGIVEAFNIFLTGRKSYEFQKSCVFY